MTRLQNQDTPEAAAQTAQLASAVAHIAAAAQPGVIYSTPITVGAYTIITASEIAVGSGFGSGFTRTDPPTEQHHAAPPTPTAAGGMGGGGGSAGRPVAIIVIGPEGVTVKPVIDVTKLALTGLTVVGTLMVVLRRIFRS